MFEFIANILAYLIRPIYSLVGNYGWTIIIFTVLIKLVTMPFSIKSQKSMARMQQVQPLINEIQKKYANNREKMQSELMKVYDKYQISPTGGCMPMIFQLVILMGFIDIVYRPYTYLLNIPKSAFAEAAKNAGLEATKFAANQLSVVDYPEIMNALNITKDSLDLNFLGINLSKILSQNRTDIVMWILPVIALALTVLSTLITQKQAVNNQSEKQKNDPQAQQAAAMSKSMYVMMPLMTAWITYTWPLGCALYWIISTLTQLLQQLFINEFIVKKMKPIVLTKKKTKPQVKKPTTSGADFWADVIDTTEGDNND